MLLPILNRICLVYNVSNAVLSELTQKSYKKLPCFIIHLVTTPSPINHYSLALPEENTHKAQYEVPLNPAALQAGTCQSSVPTAPKEKILLLQYRMRYCGDPAPSHFEREGEGRTGVNGMAKNESFQGRMEGVVLSASEMDRIKENVRTTDCATSF